MGGKNSAPKPDPRLTQIQGDALLSAMGIQERQMQLLEDRAPLEEQQMLQNLALTQRQQELNEQQQAWNAQDRERLLRREDLYEQQLGDYLNEANAFSKANRESELTAQMLPRALADVKQANAINDAAQRRDLMRAGVSPESGRYAKMASERAGEGALREVLAYQNTRDSIRQQVEAESDKYRNNALNALAGNTGALTGTVSQGANLVSNSANIMGAGANAFQNAMNGATSRLGAAANTATGVASAAGSAYDQQYNRYMNAQNANTSNWAAGLGAVAQLGAMFSDRRLKRDIKRIGVDGRTGLNLYEYEFIHGDGQRWRGVMADEVREKYPEAVFRVGEFDAVDYAKLGLKVEAVL